MSKIPLGLSLYVNVLLIICFVTYVFLPKVIEWYQKKKKLKERQEKTTLKRFIRKEVKEYLENLQK